MTTPRDPRRDSDCAGKSAPEPTARARWTPPEIVHHGSIRQLVRGISGFLTDTFGKPGMRKV
jgi:hypothetical protein